MQSVEIFEHIGKYSLLSKYAGNYSENYDFRNSCSSFRLSVSIPIGYTWLFSGYIQLKPHANKFASYKSMPRKQNKYSRGSFYYASVKSPSFTQPIFLKNIFISGHKIAGKIIAISASPIQSVLVMAVLTPALISSTQPV